MPVLWEVLHKAKCYRFSDNVGLNVSMLLEPSNGGVVLLMHLVSLSVDLVSIAMKVIAVYSIFRQPRWDRHDRRGVAHRKGPSPFPKTFYPIVENYCPIPYDTSDLWAMFLQSIDSEHRLYPFVCRQVINHDELRKYPS